jgi:TAT (twin-arginine translocation) pathway-exported protein
MNIQHLRALQAAQLFARPHRHGALTRRQFLKAGGAATALAVSSGIGLPQAVGAASQKKSPADPRPIPYGTPFLFPDPTIFHVEAPGYPLPNPPFDTNPATNDPSTITDFNGFVGLVFVGGQGTHHDLVTDRTETLYWEVDMRFMVGEYVGKDGRHHHGTFGFV